MDMKGWDVIYASGAGRLNQILAASSHQLLPSFSYSSQATQVSLSGTFGPWAIQPGGTANRINLKVPVTEGTLSAPGFGGFSLAGVEPVLNVALTLVEARGQRDVQNLAFDITDVAPSLGSATGGQVYLATADASGTLTTRDPSGTVAAILRDALPECFVANAEKISFVFASVFMSPGDQPWLKPTGTGVSYFQSVDGTVQAVAVKTVTQSPWAASSLSAAIDPNLLAPGASLFFSLSQAVFMRDLLLPVLPGAIGHGVTPDCFQFNGPARPDQQYACSITNTRSFGVGSVENAGTHYYPQIDSFRVTISGSQITTTASGHFDVTGLAGAWVSFDNLQVVNELYYDPGSKTVKYHLVSQTKPSVDKHIPWEYSLLAIGGLIGVITIAIINVVVVVIDNVVQSALQGEGDLSVGAIPLQTAVWSGLKAFDVAEAGLEQAFVIRGSAS